MTGLAGGRVVLASGNRGKLAELTALLAPTGCEVVSQADLGVGEVPETGVTFLENALIKARNASRVTGLPAIADDSGIVVDALGGAPGVRSARYGGPGATDEINCRTLLLALENVPPAERGATFVSVIVCLRHADDPLPALGEGQWHGRVLEAPRGTGGHGYDPLFFDPQAGASAAELSPAQKNARSHRGRALDALLAALAARRGEGAG